MVEGHDDGRGQNGTGLPVDKREMKKIFFLSDAHLGSRAIANCRENERLLCGFLDSIKGEAQAVYLLGDMFDFWFEYRNVVPKGAVRFLGKLAELTDCGVEVHLFTGNHDIWTFDYLERECGVAVHRGPETLDLCVGGKTARFFLAHGDGLCERSGSFRFIRGVFHNSVCQWLFRNLFPADWGVELGLRWAYLSRLKHEGGVCGADGCPRNELGDPVFMSYGAGTDGKDIVTDFDPVGDPLVVFAKEHYGKNPDVNYYVFGHRHVEFDLVMSRSCRMLILGDCFRQYSYACWTGDDMVLDNYN